MPLPDYQITVINPATGLTNWIYDGAALYDLRYNRALNDIGALALTLPSRTEMPSVFSLDSLVEVSRTSPLTGKLQVEDTYLTRLTHRFREGNEERFVVGALSLNHLLARRVIDPADDPLSAGGYSTKAGPADLVLRAYAREQIGDLASAGRSISTFNVGPVLTVGSGVGKRSRYENLFEVFQELAKQGGVDFVVSRIIGNTFRLTIQPMGGNLTRSVNYPFAPFVMFNPSRANLPNASLLYDRKKEANFCYALGQGQGDSRILTKLQGATLYDSILNRIEFAQDIRLAERGQTSQLLTGARDALREKQPQREFTFQPTGNQPGATYRLDFDLGDRVTAAWDTEEVNLRVTDVELGIDSGGETISIKLEPVA
ncbi:MAG: hypothetical protein ABI690_13575 [Chloroflexota bacterium]